MLDELARELGELHDRRSRAISSIVARMISRGDLRHGASLPTIRKVAAHLGVSPTTVSEAWQQLLAAGLIETRGRGGSTVAFERRMGPTRSQRMGSFNEPFAQSLASGSPDPTLMPSISSMVPRVAADAFAPFYPTEPVLPTLSRKVLEDWPFLPDELTIMDGALDAIDRALAVTTSAGDRIVVEDPNFPPLLDILDARRCEIVPVRLDDEGMRIDELQDALESQPTAIVLQPRAQNPTGTVMSARRARSIARLLADLPTLIIEDDHSYGISNATLWSIGAYLPERTVHVRSFSKGYGPDLRLAAAGGPTSVITAMNLRRLLGPGWSSRILQAILLQLLDDPAALDALERSRRTYATRRSNACEQLRAAGIDVPDGDGINLWVPVDNEQAALVGLAARGFGAAAGRPFEVRPSGRDHIRITIGACADDLVADVASAVASVARFGHLTVRPT